jgi:transcriptional regulator with XRE-family HTH domain
VTRSIRLKPRLKEAREKKSFSQADLGRAVVARGLPGLRANHIGLFELGYRDATWPEVELLAGVLEVDPYWLSDRPRPGPATPIGTGLAKAKEEPSTAPIATPPTSAPAAAAAGNGSPATALQPPARTAPVNGDSTPGQPSLRLPPPELPARNGSTELVYRTELSQMLTKANQTLTDRSLAPAEWRAWRDHSEKLKAALRALQ